MFNEFFAVTVSPSLYRVWEPQRADGIQAPTVTRLLPGIEPGDRPISGAYLSIGKQLVAYDPHFDHFLLGFYRKVVRVEGVPAPLWKGRTNDVVALFVGEGEARSCYRCPDLEPCDGRWLDSTRHVLDRIGNKHPFFKIARSRDLRLAPRR